MLVLLYGCPLPQIHDIMAIVFKKGGTIMLRHKYLREVPLPDGLTNSDIYRALEDTQAFFLLSEREPASNSAKLFRQTTLVV